MDSATITDNVVQVSGADGARWTPLTFEQALAAAALRWPHQEALVIEGTRWTFSRLQAEAQRLCKAQ